MAAWICQWLPDDGDPPSPCSGDLYVILYGPSNADGIGTCVRHLSDLTTYELARRRFVVVSRASQIPAPAALQSPYQEAS